MNSIVSQCYDPDNDIWGLPQTYKGIKFYPIKVKETKLKNQLHRLFFYPKSYISDRIILRMSYLKFLLYVIGGSNLEGILTELSDFLYAITHIQKPDNIKDGDKPPIYYDYEPHPEQEDLYDKFSVFIFINGEKISEQDFDNIREILLEQNGSNVEYIESYNPELEQKLIFMNHNIEDIDFKDEIFSFCALTKMTENEAGEKTLFQFNARFEREMMLEQYNLFKPLEVTGQIYAKDKRTELYKHYLRHISKSGRYDGVLIDLNKFMEDSGLNNPESGLNFER